MNVKRSTLALSLSLLLVAAPFAGLRSAEPVSSQADFQFQLTDQPLTPAVTAAPATNLVIRDRFAHQIPSSRAQVPQPAAAPRVIPSSVAKKTAPKPKYAGAIGTASHAIRGTASWYCKAGVSICHHSYPPGSMVAAACLKLRRAMGSNWRGKTVTVVGNGRSVRVKLVDWCGSTDKLIDLYWAPMSRLGGKGVLPVRVEW